MKNLLSMLAVSALVGTSASNLKPVFISNVVNHGFKSNQLNNKDISIKNQNNTNPFDFAKINQISNITDIVFSVNGETMFVSTINGVYKSVDGGINFSIIKCASTNIIKLTIDKKDNVFASDYDGKIYKSNGTDEFVEIKGTSGSIKHLTTDQYDNIYAGNGNGTIYKSNGTDEFTEIAKLTGAITSLAVDKNGIIFASTANGYNDGYVYKSTDGNTFIPMSGTSSAVWSLAIDKNGIIFAGNGSGIVYKSTDGNTFIPMSGTSEIIRILIIDNDNNVYAGTQISSGETGTIYKSNGTDEFTEMNTFNNIGGLEWTLAINNNNNDIYSGIYRGLYKTNPINLLLNINKPDAFNKSWPLYKGIVYNSVQKIDIKEKLVASAQLDGNSITIPTKDLDIPIGEHNLILTLKDKALASIFGGDPNTGQVAYKLWVKNAIDKNKIDYQTKIDDTQLYTGLVSNTGNTNNADIIQTKIKNGSGTHNASINIDFKDILIDFDVNKSFYVLGRVDETTNDFTETGTHQIFSKNLNINTDGIYHLHLIDVVGNTYDSYLELGENNWKLQGKFDDQILNDKANKLNVTVDSHSASQEVKQEAMGWLDNYKNIADSAFNNTMLTKGKGFNISIDSDLKGDYKSFLDPITYVDSKTQYAINQSKLDKVVIGIAIKKLQDGLVDLPQNLNVDTKNVVNKSTLDSYKNWINNYQNFLNQNKDKWINDITKIASRGFATTEQERQIKDQVSQFLNNDNIKKYLKNIVWEDNKLLKATSNDYQQYIELDKLQSDTIDWVNTNMKDINIAYQNAIKNAESGLNLHGYTIDEILNGKQKPQTKNEIDNFAVGQSYHDWLQSQVNIKFHGWQLKIGLPIAIISLIIIVIAGIFIRWRTNPKYRGYWRARQLDKQDKVAEMKKNKKY